MTRIQTDIWLPPFLPHTLTRRRPSQPCEGSWKKWRRRGSGRDNRRKEGGKVEGEGEKRRGGRQERRNAARNQRTKERREGGREVGRELKRKVRKGGKEKS